MYDRCFVCPRPLDPLDPLATQTHSRGPAASACGWWPSHLDMGDGRCAMTSKCWIMIIMMIHNDPYPYLNLCVRYDIHIHVLWFYDILWFLKCVQPNSITVSMSQLDRTWLQLWNEMVACGRTGPNISLNSELENPVILPRKWDTLRNINIRFSYAFLPLQILLTA